MNPLDVIMKFFFDNIFFFLMMGFFGFIAVTYFKFGKRIKYKIIDRDEVERLKFLDAMRFNKTSKYYALYHAKLMMNNGGSVLNKNYQVWSNFEKIGNIESYLEFEQVPIKMIEKEGKITYLENTNEPPMKLIGMAIKKPLFWRIPNPFAKAQPMLIENNDEMIMKDETNHQIVIPEELGFDKFMGYYYMIAENVKPKLRNVLDARILTTDFSLMASRYFSKSQEQCVYSPEAALQMATKQTELNIELAKRRGIQQTT